MKRFLLPLAIVLLAGSVSALQAESVVVAEDDASQGTYENGWGGESNGGSGFGPWTLQCRQVEGRESNAGFFIATINNNTDMGEVGLKGKAFGFFANGEEFETAVAFRPFTQALKTGDSFSFVMKAGDFRRKFETDSPEPGSIGLTLRSGNATSSPENYNAGARFEFGIYEGVGNFQIYDGEPNHDTGIALSDAALSVTFTLLSADTYELEVTSMPDKTTTKLGPRKLGGTAGESINSFCAFNRDGETSDAYFNGFQVAHTAD